MNINLITNEKSLEAITKLKKIINNDFIKNIDNIEKSILNFSNEYAYSNDTPFLAESIYDTKLDEIISALSKYPDLIKTKEDAIKIALLKPEELNPENYDKLLKKKIIEEYKKNEKNYSSAFKCSKCKKSRSSVSQKQ